MLGPRSAKRVETVALKKERGEKQRALRVIVALLPRTFDLAKFGLAEQ